MGFLPAPSSRSFDLGRSFNTVLGRGRTVTLGGRTFITFKPAEFDGREGWRVTVRRLWRPVTMLERKIFAAPPSTTPGTPPHVPNPRALERPSPPPDRSVNSTPLTEPQSGVLLAPQLPDQKPYGSELLDPVEEESAVLRYDTPTGIVSECSLDSLIRSVRSGQRSAQCRVWEEHNRHSGRDDLHHHQPHSWLAKARRRGELVLGDLKEEAEGQDASSSSSVARAMVAIGAVEPPGSFSASTTTTAAESSPSTDKNTFDAECGSGEALGKASRDPALDRGDQDRLPLGT
ncbi:hypothetical protein FS837_002826 [Tulasnella sp. UAMH 9824]|nr:hypothetical protein FS837_002826 [Tulasnella sp. UAMH 9824]